MSKKIYIILLLELNLLLLVLIYFRKEQFKSKSKSNSTSYTKGKRKNRINFYTGLHSSNTNMLEIMCLDELKKNFKCNCNKKRNHLPEILNTRENAKDYIIEMTHTGTAIKHLSKEKISKLKKKKLELNNQINCILANLKRAKVYHSDMHIDGKNMTMTDDGDLCLIDFDISYIDNFKPKRSKTDKFIKRGKDKNNVSRKNSYKQFYDILHKKGLM